MSPLSRDFTGCVAAARKPGRRSVVGCTVWRSHTARDRLSVQPAMRGRRRCGLHGGIEHRTANGLTGLHEAGGQTRDTDDLRWRQVQMSGINSAKAMRDPSMRAHFLQIAFQRWSRPTSWSRCATWCARIFTGGIKSG